MTRESDKEGVAGQDDDAPWLVEAGRGAGFTLTQKAALLAIQARPLPDGAPGPLGDELLSRPRKRRCVLHSIVDVLMAEDSPANLEPLFEEAAVQFGELGFCGRHYGKYGEIMMCKLGDK